MNQPQDEIADALPIPPGYAPVFDLGFNAHIGKIYRKLAEEDGQPHHYVFDVQPHHLNASGFIHGGALSTLADVVLGSTVAHAVGHMCSTVSLNCEFLAAAGLGERIEGAANITRQTRSVVFVSGSLFVGERTLLTASGIWKILERHAL
jgi:uncharacterized protein (TIGR00369 family)